MQLDNIFDIDLNLDIFDIDLSCIDEVLKDFDKFISEDFDEFIFDFCTMQ